MQAWVAGLRSRGPRAGWGRAPRPQHLHHSRHLPRSSHTAAPSNAHPTDILQVLVAFQVLCQVPAHHSQAPRPASPPWLQRTPSSITCGVCPCTTTWGVRTPGCKLALPPSRSSRSSVCCTPHREGQPHFLCYFHCLMVKGPFVCGFLSSPTSLHLFLPSHLPPAIEYFITCHPLRLCKNTQFPTGSLMGLVCFLLL